MLQRRFAIVTLLAFPLLVSWGVAKDPPRRGGFTIGSGTYKDQAAFIAAGGRCATPEATPAQRAAVRKALAARKPAAAADAVTIVIPVQFIHLTNGSSGQITEEQRCDQIAVLNDAYNPYGFEFCYDPVKYPPKVENNAAWYKMTPGSQAEEDCKTALHEDTATVLNFYTASPTGGLLGWATFPFPSVDPLTDGVVCLDESLPGGSASPYNLGDTATHEVGHWLGLYHTFQDGCSGDGDEVSDTVAHSGPDFGCPSCGPACLTGQCSQETNFMNYTDDDCMFEFTAGQGARLSAMVGLYRASLGSVACDGAECESSSCTLTRLAGSAKKLLPFPLSQDDMDGLRRFRDVVLRRSEAGRTLSELYYRNGNALTELLLKDPQLAGETLMHIAKQLPAIERAVDRDGTIHLAAKDFTRSLELLDRYRKAAPENLARTLDQVEGLVKELARTDAETANVTITFPKSSVAGLKPTPDPISTQP